MNGVSRFLSRRDKHGQKRFSRHGRSKVCPPISAFSPAPFASSPRMRSRDALSGKLQVLEAQSAEALVVEGALAVAQASHATELEKREKELLDVRALWEADKAAWEVERATAANDMRERTSQMQRDVDAGEGTQAQLDACLASLNALVQARSIELETRPDCAEACSAAEAIPAPPNESGARPGPGAGAVRRVAATAL